MESMYFCLFLLMLLVTSGVAARLYSLTKKNPDEF
jgi:hypothetical protein